MFYLIIDGESSCIHNFKGLQSIRQYLISVCEFMLFSSFIYLAFQFATIHFILLFVPVRCIRSYGKHMQPIANILSFEKEKKKKNSKCKQRLNLNLRWMDGKTTKNIYHLAACYCARCRCRSLSVSVAILLLAYISDICGFSLETKKKKKKEVRKKSIRFIFNIIIRMC